MRRATILLASMLAAGTAAIHLTAPTSDARKQSQQDQSDGVIKKGMTLDEVVQATGGNPAPVGAPKNGVQTYRVSTRQYNGDGGVNDHPTITFYMFGLKDGKVTWVHKTQ